MKALLAICVMVAWGGAGFPVQAESPVISLYLTTCIDGTLHGKPHKACREFQLKPRWTGDHAVEKCASNADALTEDWLDELQTYMPDAALSVISKRCAPQTLADEGDPDL